MIVRQGHAFFFPIQLNIFIITFLLDNILQMLQDLRRLSFLTVANAYVSVDTFFVLR